MTAREICRSYHSARHKAQQIQILAELNAVDSLEIIKALVRGGERLPDSTVNKLFKRLDKLEMEIREREPPCPAVIFQLVPQLVCVHYFYACRICRRYFGQTAR